MLPEVKRPFAGRIASPAEGNHPLRPGSRKERPGTERCAPVLRHLRGARVGCPVRRVTPRIGQQEDAEHVRPFLAGQLLIGITGNLCTLAIASQQDIGSRAGGDNRPHLRQHTRYPSRHRGVVSTDRQLGDQPRQVPHPPVGVRATRAYRHRRIRVGQVGIAPPSRPQVRGEPRAELVHLRPEPVIRVPPSRLLPRPPRPDQVDISAARLRVGCPRASQAAERRRRQASADSCRPHHSFHAAPRTLSQAQDSTSGHTSAPSLTLRRGR
jgi:hypothetical protein